MPFAFTYTRIGSVSIKVKIHSREYIINDYNLSFLSFRAVRITIGLKDPTITGRRIIHSSSQPEEVGR